MLKATIQDNPVPAITIEGIGFNYPGEPLPALDNITFTVPAGSCFGLLGPNGAGKSTLLALLTGILPLQRGKARVHGCPVSDSRSLHEQVALVPQDYAFYPTLTVMENLSCFAGLYGFTGALKRERIEFAVQVCGLSDIVHRRAAACSGGVRRRLNLAIGLLNRPAVLYLDEPTVGIDAQSRHFILESITGLQQQGMTIVYTSHYMEEIQSVCDRLAIIDHGRLLVADTLDAILARAASMPDAARPPSAQRLEEFYLSLTRHALRD